MENFVVSARKYRPAIFNTVVGQSSITTTLKNAIRSNHLAQAFLFCGPRGVGKTTCARILAKTINCTNLTSETEACNQCESCTSFNQGQAIDIYELDAASNNSVDDIRNLVDTVRIPPQLMESNQNAKKVYVIDEVHMLSAAAFNAFLKTLEEPPRYAIFILATTERHKILPTILSRCQIFNFNRIQVEDIASHLAYIANNENVIADPDALHIIAQKADGALRDACSIFDQVVSFAGTNLTYKAVIENLNVLDYEYYFKMTDHLLADQIPGAMLVYNDILSNGFDGHTFVAGLAEHFRNLLVSKDPQTLQLLEAGQNIRERYKEQAMRCPPIFLLRGLSLITKCDVGYKSARNPRLLAEFMLMQLCALNGQSSGEKKNDELISNSFNNAPLSTQPAPQIAVVQNQEAVKKEEPVQETPAVIESKPVTSDLVNANPVSQTSSK
ncbi:MAG: DNA polymerase III subunit gamma/tau, partial [Bacteroidia bacterium]